MNTFDPLSLLKKILARDGYGQPVELHRSSTMDKVLEQLKKAAKMGGQTHIPKDLQIEAVQRFWRTKKFTSFRDARWVSFGLGLDAWGDESCLLEKEGIFDIVQDELHQWLNNPRQFRKCYQGLMRNYFEYDGMAPNANAVGRKNWLLLRSYLQQNLPSIQDNKSINPEWVDCAQENPNIFTEKPAQAYSQELLQDNSERIDRVYQLIGISDASWFTRALLIGQIEAAVQQTDTVFHKLVSRLLQRIADNHVVRDEGLRLILDRYIKIAQPPLHIELKECAAQWWGNPWLSSNKSAWSGVSEAACNMISQWLAAEFINLFFTKLAEDGSTDNRRVQFWQQYVPYLTYIRFALGKKVTQSREVDFLELREKLNGLTIELDDPIRSNNAFIMGIGDLMAVEFSTQSNAFYGYNQKTPLPFDLDIPVRSGPVDGPNSLKSRDCVLRLGHKDNIHGYLFWEDRFKDELRNNFDVSPDKNSNSKPTYTNFNKSNYHKKEYFLIGNKSVKEFTEELNCKFQDNTEEGGALWILLSGFNMEIAKTLLDSGFKFAPGKGWWKR